MLDWRQLNKDRSRGSLCVLEGGVELEVGPVARNIIGARLSAARLVQVA